MSGLSKAPMPDQTHSENDPLPNSSKTLTGSPVKPLKKPHLSKKFKTIFSAQAPLKIKR